MDLLPLTRYLFIYLFIHLFIYLFIYVSLCVLGCITWSSSAVLSIGFVCVDGPLIKN